MKKAVIISLVILVGAGVWWKFFRSNPDQGGKDLSESEIQLIDVEKGSLLVTVEATGRVVPEQEVEIKCKASGEIIQLPVDVSDVVKQGDLLVQIDPQYEKRSVNRSKVALAVSEARLAQAKLNLRIAERDLATERTRAESALKSAEAKSQETEAKLGRVRQLLEKKMASREELDGTETANAQARSDLENARARVLDLTTIEVQIENEKEDVKIAEAQVESDKISLSDTNQRLEDTTVLAPIDGVVGERNVQVGQIIASGINNVGGGTTMMTLADLSRMYVLVSVDESDIGKIRVGQLSEITVDAHPDDVFPGEVVRVATKGSLTSNVVTFEVKTEITGDQRDLLKPEMTANVEITAVEKDNVILVPVDAVGGKGRERFVTIAEEDGSTEERPVTIGDTDGERMEIVSGLSEGETIVASGSSGLWSQDEDSAGDDARASRIRRHIQMRMMSGGRGR